MERALQRADEAWARFDGEQVIVQLSTALRGFTAAGQPRRAAMTCVRLGSAYTYVLGNMTAGRAWYTRARRLLADEEPCVEQGWVAIAAMGCDVDDPAELLAAAELALERARRFGDVNLETKALADAGLARVQLGRVTEGMALLDEAMALACGPADDLGNAARSVCSFFTACYHAADFDRADAWADTLRRNGLIGATGPAPAFLSGHCDSVHATLLMELGRWTDAEQVLQRARQHSRRSPARPAGIPTSPSPTCGSARAATLMPNSSSSARTSPFRRCFRRRACTWRAATTIWRGQSPAAACAPLAATNCGPWSC